MNVVDRETQTSLTFDHPARHECDASIAPAVVSQTQVNSTQQVDAPRRPCSTAPADPSPFQRSVYSGWKAPEQVAAAQMKKAASECGQDVDVEYKGSFEDSVAEDHLATGVRDCRKHIDDIGKEAASVEQLLNQLSVTLPQRDRVCHL